MRLTFNSVHWKFNVDSENAKKKKKKKKKMHRKIYCFLDHFISIANGKISLLLPEYP